MGGGGAKHAFVATIGDRSVAGPSDGRHSCRPCSMGASPPKQVLAPTGRNSFLFPPGTYRSCFLRATLPPATPERSLSIHGGDTIGGERVSLTGVAYLLNDYNRQAVFAVFPSLKATPA